MYLSMPARGRIDIPSKPHGSDAKRSEKFLRTLRGRDVKKCLSIKLF